MKACLSFTTAIAALLIACSPGGPSLDTRTFALKYLHGQDAIPIVAPYVSADRPTAKGGFTVSDNAITVRETPDNLDKIARVLAQYDRPRPFIRLTFHLIEADGPAIADPAIRDVEATLRQLFRFRGYRLVGEGVVSATDRSEVTQMLAAEPGHYALSTSVERLAGAAASATVELGGHLEGRGGSFRSTLTISFGKTAVLGCVQPQPNGRTLVLAGHP